jgi:hypothetical protein
METVTVPAIRAQSEVGRLRTVIVHRRARRSLYDLSGLREAQGGQYGHYR